MECYKGVLSALGPSDERSCLPTGPGKRYRYLDIGVHRIERVYASRQMVKLLHGALSAKRPATLWITPLLLGRLVLGISHPDGTIYRAAQIGTPALVLLMAACFALLAIAPMMVGSAVGNAVSLCLMLAGGVGLVLTAYLLTVTQWAFLVPADKVV